MNVSTIKLTISAEQLAKACDNGIDVYFVKRWRQSIRRGNAFA